MDHLKKKKPSLSSKFKYIKYGLGKIDLKENFRKEKRSMSVKAECVKSVTHKQIKWKSI